jgi:hypothetical protein
MIETIFNFIQNKESELNSKNKFPTHILDVEIYNKFGKLESKPILLKLIDDNRIIWGRTINNIWFKIKSENK